MQIPEPLLAVLAIVASVSITFALVDDDGDGTPDRVTVTVAKKAPPAGDLQAPAPDAGPTEQPAQSELRDETPPEVPDERLERGLRKTDRLGEQLEPRPVGGAQNYSCRVDLSGGVWSSYSIKPTEGVYHFTVSANVAGWGDVLGIEDYFSRTRIASADRILDFEANCLQMTPITTGKAWTAGAANEAACFQYEIIATGRETKQQWLDSPLIKDGVLAAVTRDDARRCGIPLKRVDPVGCVFPPGITDHNALECGNDHTDVAPNFPWRTVMRQVRTGYGPVPKVQRRRCREVHRLRHDGKNTPWQRERIDEIRRGLRQHELRCVGGKIKRR